MCWSRPTRSAISCRSLTSTGTLLDSATYVCALSPPSSQIVCSCPLPAGSIKSWACKAQLDQQQNVDVKLSAELSHCADIDSAPVATFAVQRAQRRRHAKSHMSLPFCAVADSIFNGCTLTLQELSETRKQLLDGNTCSSLDRVECASESKLCPTALSPTADCSSPLDSSNSNSLLVSTRDGSTAQLTTRTSSVASEPCSEAPLLPSNGQLLASVNELWERLLGFERNDFLCMMQTLGEKAFWQ